VQNDLAGSPFQVLTGTAFSKYYQVVARLKNSAGVEIGSIRSNVVGVPTSAPTFQTSAALAIP
jgi:hypothetical protein